MSDASPNLARAPAFVGNAVRAAGFRLAGFHTLSPASGQEVVAIEAVRPASSLLVIDADVAERIPAARLHAWLIEAAPPVAIAPRADGAASRADPAERARAQLGLDA
jgi:vacuolar-type H+-ATPase subunit F/Vma7